LKIYTRKGDAGDTSLFGGERVHKDNIRVAAYGTVDELNSLLGLAIAGLPQEMHDWRDPLLTIQFDCFVLGSILATPAAGEAKPAHIPDLPAARVTELEGWIDRLDEGLPELKAFVLPGGSEAAALIHLARSVCRRAERRVVRLTQTEPVEPVILMYLNRLSDLLFTLARAANARQGVADAEWHPDGAA
jgi:cob(I)alamin adenosyltransferase